MVRLASKRVHVLVGRETDWEEGKREEGRELPQEEKGFALFSSFLGRY